MTALYIISFILLVVATFALLKLTPEQINKDINELFNKQQTLKDQALTARGKKKKNRIVLELERMRRALQETGKEKQFSLACAAALLLMVAGCVVAIAIDNMFLIPVLAIAFALIPFAYLTKTISIYETQVRQELETALSIITTSYIRSDNLVSAVQENLSYLKPPIKGIFEGFLAEATIISPDIRQAIHNLKDKVKNSIFEEWCDTLISCQNDRTLKDTLMPVVSKLTDVRLVNNSLKTMLSEARREYWMMVCKVNTCVQNIYEIWEQTADKKSAQLVFCDLSTPKNDGSFNVYDDIRNKLIERGIPADEIAFVHTADSDAKKKELFAKVRRGQVRVLMGSTFKMGAGTNVQDRLIALHDLDVPWHPADLEQRAGRIVRQGNSNPEVDLYRYVTEGTFDAYSYQLLESKQKFISQIMTSKSPVRSAEDVDETALSYAEIKALASGNPKIMEKMQLDADVAKLKLQKADHLSQRYGLEDALIKKFPREIAEQEERIKCLIEDMETAKNNTFPNENGFSPMVIMGTTYTEKAEAGKEILAICERITNPEGRPLGEYRGFKTDIGFDTGQKEFSITLRGSLFHKVPLGKDPNGIITRLDNAIEAFEKRKQGCEYQLEELHKQVEKAKAEIAAPFPLEAELDEKCKRLAELKVLSSIFRKFVSVKMKYCAGKPGEGAAKPRLFAP